VLNVAIIARPDRIDPGVDITTIRDERQAGIAGGEEAVHDPRSRAAGKMVSPIATACENEVQTVPMRITGLASTGKW